MNNRILAFFLALVIVIATAAIAVPVYAADSVPLTVTADKTTAAPGSTIHFSVSIGAVTNLGGLELYLTIPKGLTFVSASIPSGVDTALDADGEILVPTADNGYKFSYSAQTKGYTGSTNLIFLTFDCAVDADANGNLPVTVTVESMFDNTLSLKPIPFSITPANVKISSDAFSSVLLLPVNGAISKPWVMVDDANTDMVHAYNANGTLVDSKAAFDSGVNDSTSGDFKFFMGTSVGHLINNTSTTFNGVVGSRVDFNFTGTGVALLSQFHDVKSSSANLEFYIDGNLVGTLDKNEYAPDSYDGTHTKRKVYFQTSGLADTAHTFTVKISSVGQASVDAFAYIPSGSTDPWIMVDDSNTSFVRAYNANGTAVDSAAIFKAGQNDVQSPGGEYKFFMGSTVGHLINNTSTTFNAVVGSYVEFSFTGTGVALLSQFHDEKEKCADLAFYVDGNLLGTVEGTDYGCVSMNGSHTVRKAYFQVSDLSNGDHVLKVITTSAGQASIDAFAYIPSSLSDEETPDAPADEDLSAEWIIVDDAVTSMVRAYSADGTLINTKAIFDAGVNNTLSPCNQFKFFMGTSVGHLINNTSTTFNNTPGSYVEFLFSGTGVALLSQFHDLKSVCANLEFYIDGNLVGSLSASQYGADGNNPTTNRKIYFQTTGLTDTTHTFTVKSTSAGQATVDAFAYIPGQTADDDPVVSPLPSNGVIVEPWVLIDDANTGMVEVFNANGNKVDTKSIFEAGVNNVTGGDFKFFMGSTVGHLINSTSTTFNGVAGSYVTFKFKGTGVALLSQFHDVKSVCANLEFYIDGVSVGTLSGNSYGSDGSPSTDRMVYFQKHGLSEAEHTFTVKTTSAGQASIDAFAFIPYEASETEAPETDRLPDECVIDKPWVLVDDSNTNMVHVYNADGVKVDNASVFAAGVNDVMSGQFKFFMGDTVGHLINNTSTTFNGTPGAYVDFIFNGTAVALISQFHDIQANCADLEFILDGKTVGTLNASGYCSTGNSPSVNRKVYFQMNDLKDGEHTLRVKTTSGGQATIDAFAYIPSGANEPWVIIDDSETNVVHVYNDNGTKVNSAAIFAAGVNNVVSEGDQFKFFMGNTVGHLINSTSTTFNGTVGSYVEFKFSGTGVALLSQFHDYKHLCADLEFYIDGVLVGSLKGNDYGCLEMDGTHIARKYYFQTVGLKAGEHTFTVKATSEGQATIDAFAYIPYEEPETNPPETEAPETEAPETEAPETQAPVEEDVTLDAGLKLNDIKATYGDTAVVKKADGSELTSTSTRIGTGFTIHVDNTIYTVIVKGDVDGNGRIALADINAVVKHLNGTSTLTGAYFSAACTGTSSRLSMRDINTILKLING